MAVVRSLSAVRIFVDDLARARTFYRDVLELREKAVTPEWLVFDLDGKDVVVEPSAADDPEFDQKGRFLGFSFAVDDIDRAYRDLKAKGVHFDHPPEKQMWGGTLAFPRDPAGNILTLVG